MNEKLNKYFVANQSGGSEYLYGVNIMDAFKRTGRKTETGEINFSILDWFCLVPVPLVEESNKQAIENSGEYEIFTMDSPEDNWEPCDEIFNSFEKAEEMMKLLVRKNGYFSGLVVHSKTGKPFSWQVNYSFVQ